MNLGIVGKLYTHNIQVQYTCAQILGKARVLLRGCGVARLPIMTTYQGTTYQDYLYTHTQYLKCILCGCYPLVYESYFCKFIFDIDKHSLNINVIKLTLNIIVLL